MTGKVFEVEEEEEVKLFLFCTNSVLCIRAKSLD